MLNQFFDSVVVLTTARRERVEAELFKYRIEAEYFRSLMYQPKKSFNMSMKMIVDRFLVKGGDTLLILEDDVLFQHMDELEEVMEELWAVPWDLFYLGGNYVKQGNAKKSQYVSEHLRHIHNAWTTHAFAMTKEVAKFISRNYKADIMFDAFLDEQVLNRYTAIATVPMLAIQEPDFSSIWGHHVDYSDIWNRSIDFIR